MIKIDDLPNQYGHPRMKTIELLEHAMSGATARQAFIVPVATGAKEFEDHKLTAPIYATGFDGDVIVTMFADGRIETKTRIIHGGRGSISMPIPSAAPTLPDTSTE